MYIFIQGEAKVMLRWLHDSQMEKELYDPIKQQPTEPDLQTSVTKRRTRSADPSPSANSAKTSATSPTPAHSHHTLTNHQHDPSPTTTASPLPTQIILQTNCTVRSGQATTTGSA